MTSEEQAAIFQAWRSMLQEAQRHLGPKLPIRRIQVLATIADEPNITFRNLCEDVGGKARSIDTDTTHLGASGLGLIAVGRGHSLTAKGAEVIGRIAGQLNL